MSELVIVHELSLGIRQSSLNRAMGFVDHRELGLGAVNGHELVLGVRQPS